MTENGYGKRTAIEEYLRGGEGENAPKTPQNRGGYGLRNYHITKKTGKAACIKVVGDNDDVLIISDDGTMIRMAAADISTYSRATQGVRLMRVTENARVISVARMEKEDEPDEEMGGADDRVPQDSEIGRTAGRVVIQSLETRRRPFITGRSAMKKVTINTDGARSGNSGEHASRIPENGPARSRLRRNRSGDANGPGCTPRIYLFGGRR